jgi:hypothetical protein
MHRQIPNIKELGKITKNVPLTAPTSEITKSILGIAAAKSTAFKKH